MTDATVTDHDVVRMTEDHALFSKKWDRSVRFGSPWNRRVLLGVLAIGQVAGMLLMTERPAHAYVDPGSGLLALQMLGASVAGGLFFLRRKLRNLLGGKPSRMHPTEEPASPGKATVQELAVHRIPRSNS